MSDDDRLVITADLRDTGTCPDGCNRQIRAGDPITHHDDLGVWVLADHGRKAKT